MSGGEKGGIWSDWDSLIVYGRGAGRVRSDTTVGYF